tara:strand:- start:750 stop:1490 length:741 start_codon:yes stop_codon:yes gene_type:complete
MLKSIQDSNMEIEKVIAINTNYHYYLKLFNFVSKRVGVFQALIFSILKVFSDQIHELFFCDLKSLSSLLKEYKLSSINIKGNKDWQKLANQAIDACDSRVIIIGQVGILGKEFNLKRNDRIILNSHPGMLPKFRGLDSFKWAMLEKDWEGLKTTIHIVRDKIDGGEIIQINSYNWRKLNWFFVDRQLLIISGNHLVRFLSNLKAENILEDILNQSITQKEEFTLYNKMKISKEIKSLSTYLLNKYF